MQQNDCLKKALTKQKDAVIIAIDAKDLVSEAMQRTKALPPAMIHVGQALMGSMLLLSITSKNNSTKLSLQWQVDGPFGSLYTECDHTGNLRGAVMHPQFNTNNLETSLGKGILQVRRSLVESTTGIVNAKGNVCEDLLDYLNQSEQRQCAMNLWVKLGIDESKNHPFIIKHAVGYLIEILPIKDETKMQQKMLDWDQFLQSLGGLSQWELGERPVDTMLKILSAEKEPEEILLQNVRFHCNCSEERAKRALVLANQQEGKTETSEEHLRCEFCGKQYDIIG